jgi:hypothetical protein
MKVSGSTGPSPTGGRLVARPAAGFSMAPAGAAAASAASTASSAVGGVADLSALMALQGVESAVDRRRRAFRRGSGLLDRLDGLKLALLAGDASGAAEQLAHAAREARPDAWDEAERPGLKAVLDGIDLRAAVELAKLERSRQAA